MQRSEDLPNGVLSIFPEELSGVQKTYNLDLSNCNIYAFQAKRPSGKDVRFAFLGGRKARCQSPETPSESPNWTTPTTTPMWAGRVLWNSSTVLTRSTDRGVVWLSFPERTTSSSSSGPRLRPAGLRASPFSFILASEIRASSISLGSSKVYLLIPPGKKTGSAAIALPVIFNMWPLQNYSVTGRMENPRFRGS